MQCPKCDFDDCVIIDDCIEGIKSLMEPYECPNCECIFEVRYKLVEKVVIKKGLFD